MLVYISNFFVVVLNMSCPCGLSLLLMFQRFSLHSIFAQGTLGPQGPTQSKMPSSWLIENLDHESSVGFGLGSSVPSLFNLLERFAKLACQLFRHMTIFVQNKWLGNDLMCLDFVYNIVCLSKTLLLTSCKWTNRVQL